MLARKPYHPVDSINPRIVGMLVPASVGRRRVVQMSWKQQFEAREFRRNSLWLVPVGGVALGVMLKVCAVYLEERYPAASSLAFGAGTAAALLTAIFTAMISFTGFVLTILVLVIQFAGVSFSPRTLLFVFRDRQLKLSLSLFVGTMTFSFLLLNEVSEEFVPNWGVLLAGMLVLVSILLFLHFLSHLLHGIRPENLASLIGKLGHGIIAEVYPRPAPGQQTGDSAPSAHIPASAPDSILRQPGTGEILKSVDLRGLVTEATRARVLFVVPYAIGDFVHRHGSLVEVYGQYKMDDRKLRGFFATGAERTIEQDPAFAIRVLVDIALKALSPAINDPTTATGAIDRIEDLLVDLAGRDLSTGIYRDREGVIRVIMDSPTWEDFLRLGVAEIRNYGASSLQTTRRLGALLEALLEAAPTYRQPSIEHEIELLQRSVREKVANRDDQHFATDADAQGIGATSLG